MFLVDTETKTFSVEEIKSILVEFRNPFEYIKKKIIDATGCYIEDVHQKFFKSLSKSLKTDKKAVEFWELHTEFPMNFSINDVERMNKELGEEFVLMPNGTISGRCCYSSCDCFLKSLKTQKDRATGSNWGFINHYNMGVKRPIDGTYFPGLTAIATSMFKKGISKQVFIKNLTNHYYPYNTGTKLGDKEILKSSYPNKAKALPIVPELQERGIKMFGEYFDFLNDKTSNVVQEYIDKRKAEVEA